MARETKQELAARIAADNAAADELDLSEDLFYEDNLLGIVSLIRKSSKDLEDWDLYVVRHNGFNHRWTSALIARQDWAAS